MRSRYNDSLRAERSGVLNPGVDRDFSLTRPYRPWDPPSLLYNGFWGSLVEVMRPQSGVNHPPICRADVKMGTAIPLFPVSVFVACYMASFTFMGIEQSALIHNGWGNNFRA